MGKCRFCKVDGCSDRLRSCPQRMAKITVYRKAGVKSNQNEIESRLMEYVRKYSAYSLGITSNPDALIEAEEIRSNYTKMFILWNGSDPAGIAREWGQWVKKIRSYKKYGKKLVSTGPTDLGGFGENLFSLYLLVR
jgi:hypothetical protein